MIGRASERVGLLCLPTGEKKARAATSRKRWNRILIPFHFPASSANQANHSIVNSSLPRSFVGPRQLLSLGGPRERDNQPEPATSHQTKVRLVSFLPSQKSHASEVQVRFSTMPLDCICMPAIRKNRTDNADSPLHAENSYMICLCLE